MFNFMFCQIAVTFFANPFQDILKRGYYVEFKETFKHVCAVMLVAVLHMFLTRQTVENPEVLFSLTAAAYFVLLYLGRIFRKICLRKGGKSSRGKRSLIVVTVSDLAQEVLSRFTDTSYEDFVISGIIFLDKDLTGQRIYSRSVFIHRTVNLYLVAWPGVFFTGQDWTKRKTVQIV